MAFCRRAGFTARVAVADTPGAAYALARFGNDELTRVAPRRTVEALGPLPIAALRLAPTVITAARKFGFGRIADLLPVACGPLARRLGSPAMTRLDQVLGGIHGYGTVYDDLRAWSEKHGVELNAFTWAPEYKDAGFEQDAAYLLRPDTYIAFAAPNQSITAIDGYLADKGFTLAR